MKSKIRGSNNKGLILGLQDFISYNIKAIIFGGLVSVLVVSGALLYMPYIIAMLPILATIPMIATTAILSVISFSILTSFAALVRYVKLNVFYKASKVTQANSTKVFESEHRARQFDQGRLSLCGIVSVAAVFAATDPHKFSQISTNLDINGHTLQGLKLLTNSEIQKNSSYSDLPTIDKRIKKFIYALRFTSNWLGFSIRESNFFNLIRNLTRPKRIAGLLIDWGCKNVIDTTKIVNSQGHEISWFKRFFLGGIYFHSHHRFKEMQEHLEYAQQRISCEKNPAVMLITSGLTEKLIFNNKEDINKINAKYGPSLGFSLDHYVFIDHFKILPDGKIQLRIMTWGRTAVRTIDRDVFEKNFRGIIVGDYPNRTIPNVSADAIEILPDTPEPEKDTGNDGEKDFDKVLSPIILEYKKNSPAKQSKEEMGSLFTDLIPKLETTSAPTA